MICSAHAVHGSWHLLWWRPQRCKSDKQRTMRPAGPTSQARCQQCLFGHGLTEKVMTLKGNARSKTMLRHLPGCLSSRPLALPVRPSFSCALGFCDAVHTHGFLSGWQQIEDRRNLEMLQPQEKLSQSNRIQSEDMMHDACSNRKRN